MPPCGEARKSGGSDQSYTAKHPHLGRVPPEASDALAPGEDVCPQFHLTSQHRSPDKDPKDRWKAKEPVAGETC